MTNRLTSALSPYLLQHADNPVDWWEWGDEAFAEARRRDVPVFLSVGYAACHWCHVMAHESFEDPVVAQQLNDGFVSIKVDREEHPDVDAVYMAATTALTGHGGWPMSVWLDHDGRPFYAGTYFPPAPRHSLPGFSQLLAGISSAWTERRDEVLTAAARIDAALREQQRGVVVRSAAAASASVGGSETGTAAASANVDGSDTVAAASANVDGSETRAAAVDGPEAAAAVLVGVDGSEVAAATVDWAALCWDAVTQLATSFDPQWAGFGRAPKFPPSMVMEFLLRAHALFGGATPSHNNPHRTGNADPTVPGDATVTSDESTAAGSASRSPREPAGDDGGALEMAQATLSAMARGGMYDQLAGGFARYSVDDRWVVPHFEKMLYDNALLLRAYAHWWRATGDPLAERVVRETVEFLLTDMRTGQGGFAASLDADARPPDNPDGPAQEGASYVWRPDELRRVLGDDDGTWVAALCEVTEAGTFEHGTSTLQLLRDPDDPQRWQRLRLAMRQARDRRPQPARDDKVVAAWNGMVIAALADAGDIFDEPAWVSAAESAADLLISLHLSDDGTLVRVSRDGSCSTAGGVLADYAGVAEGLLALYRATGDDSWYLLVGGLLTSMVDRFYRTDHWVDHVSDGLIPSSADPSDNAEPSGVSAAVSALLSYAALGGALRMPTESATGEAAPGGSPIDVRMPTESSAGGAPPGGSPMDVSMPTESVTGEAPLGGSPVDVRQLVIDTMTGQVNLMRGHPRFAGQWLGVAAALAAGPLEVAVVAESPDDALRRTAVMSNSPGLVIAYARPGTDTEVPLLTGRVAAGAPLAYVCRLGSCQLPTGDPTSLRTQLH